MTLEIGSLLHNRYRIQQIIAKGGMGAIYLAEDETLGIKVALKENLFSSEESSRQFRREATILASLRHPNLPRVSDHFIIPNQGQYLVMDFIEGDDIRQRLTENQVFSEDEVVLIGVAICDALAYLHNRQPPVVHRDIKPGNIKITPSGQVFLVDFGLAKISQPGQATTTGAQALTPGYASPEQYGQGTDPRSDIYSLGATLYAALTNTIPEDALSRAMGTVQLTPLRKINPNISSRMEQVIERAMDVSLNKRYQKAEEFKDALLSVLGIEQRTSPVNREAEAEAAVASRMAAPLDGATVRAPVARKPLPIAWIGGGVALLAMVIVAIVILTSGGGTGEVAHVNTETAPATTATLTETLPVVVPLTAEATPTLTATLASTDTPAPTATETLTLTPVIQATPLGGGGGQVAFVSDRSGQPQVYLINIDGTGLTPVTNFRDGACQPNWSPDGKQLVVISPCKIRQKSYEGASMFIINADGTGFRPLVSLPGGDFDPAWSPDGKAIAFASVRDGLAHIFLYDLATDKVTRLTGPSSYDRMPVWSPDGEQIAFFSNRLGGSQIFTMNKDGSEQREFSTLDAKGDTLPNWSPNGALILFNYESPLVLVERQVGRRQAQEVAIDVTPAQDGEYSRDGFWIVFESWPDGNHDIYIMLRNGAQMTRLTDDPAYDYQPTWRP